MSKRKQVEGKQRVGKQGEAAPDVLELFHPITAEWFRAVFEEATAPQREGWPAIARGESTLILAPTGTGKTLTAFLWCLDKLMLRESVGEPGCKVVYISPLKALAVDVERNLRAPLAGIANMAERQGVAVHLPEISVRTGDTSPRDRARFKRHPGEILITTPESLYLLLTSDAGEALRSVETVIIDEIHALVPTKRGAHLMLSLERLEALCGRRIQRIGLSATQRPLEEVARFLGGAEKQGSGPRAQGSEDSLLPRNRYELSIDGAVIRVDSPLAGQHQQRNLALAIASAIELRTNHGFAISNAAIETGVRVTNWPGRLEWLPSKRGHAPLLLDVAHNPAGAWALRAALAQLPEDMPRTLIFSCLADKAIDEMAQVLLPLFDSTSGDPARARDHVVLAPIQNARAASIDELLAAAQRLDVPAHAAPHVPGALAQAEAITPRDGVIVATGSIFLIGELRALALAEAVA